MRNKDRIKPIIKYIEEAWTKSPDQRLGQLLINIGVVPDENRLWHYEEMDYIPFQLHRLIPIWGTYGKDGKQPYKKISCSEMSDEHLKTIYTTQFLNHELDTLLMHEMIERGLDVCKDEEAIKKDEELRIKQARIDAIELARVIMEKVK